MKTIFINNNYIDISEFDYFNYLVANDDVYSLYNKCADEEKEVYSYLNKDSDEFNIFRLHLKEKFASYIKEKEFSTFADAANYLNCTIKLTDVFLKDVNTVFKSNFCNKYKLRITSNNKLMFIDKNVAIFDNNRNVKAFDFYNITLTIVQLYKIIHKIRNYEKSIELLCKEFQINIEDEMMLKINERNKITNNLTMIDNIERYEYLNKLINKNKFVLNAINLIAFNNTFASSEHNKDNDLVFLCTSNYLQNYLRNMNTEINSKILTDSYLRRLMILYTSLNLITLEQATKKQKRREKQSLNAKSYKYYIIKEYNHALLVEADNIAKQLLEHHITAANISNNSINSILYNKNTCEKESKNNAFYFDFSIH